MKATYTDAQVALLKEAQELFATFQSAFLHYAERAKSLHAYITRELSQVPEPVPDSPGGPPAPSGGAAPHDPLSGV